MSKPTNKPGWSSTGVEPSSNKKSQGWSAGEKPSAAEMNWLFKTISEWINHVDSDRTQGAQGDAGPQGLKGETGDVGPQGLQGLKGETGDVGPQGSEGLNGETGDTGAQGIQGPKGETGDIGAQGVQGLKGETGDVGPQGLKGITGDTGPQGIKGLTGDTGAVGPKGLTGDQGPQGITGSGTLDPAVAARITALESKAHIATPSSVTTTLSYQGTGVSSEYNNGNSGSSKTIDWSNGVSQSITLNANTTLDFLNPVSGKVYYLHLNSDYSATRNVSFPASVSFQNGSVTSLSNGFNAILSLYYNGTNYITHVISSFFKPTTGAETKNGYVTGGTNGLFSFSTSTEKLNFNTDLSFVIVQTDLGKELTTSGTIATPATGNSSDHGQGTQSSTHGYRARCIYATTLPLVNNNSSTRVHKLAFATDTTTIATVIAPNIATPVATNAWHSCTRRGIVQSTSAAYMVYTTGITAKMTFNTDTFSNLTLSALNQWTSGFGTSTSVAGISWTSSSTLTGFKITFSNESMSTVSNVIPSSPESGGYGEAVDGVDSAYYQKNTSSSVVTCYKQAKSTESWSTLATTATGAGAAASAVQGTAAGYFCGGQVNSATPSTSTSSSAATKKIIFSSDTFSPQGVSLKQSRSFAAGFEG